MLFSEKARTLIVRREVMINLEYTTKNDKFDIANSLFTGNTITLSIESEEGVWNRQGSLRISMVSTEPEGTGEVIFCKGVLRIREEYAEQEPSKATRIRWRNHISCEITFSSSTNGGRLSLDRLPFMEEKKLVSAEDEKIKSSRLRATKRRVKELMNKQVE